MKFEKQLEDAKKKQLSNRIARDAIFIILGIIFLVISIFNSVKQSKKDNINKKTTTTAITIKK